MTLSQTRSIVETRIAVGGKSIAEHNEILGLDAAMKYINSTLISRYISVYIYIYPPPHIIFVYLIFIQIKILSNKTLI